MKRATLLFLMVIFVNKTYCADLKVSAPIVTYKDDQTISGQTTIKKLESFSDDIHWSKPSVVNVDVDVENISVDVSANFVDVKAELYLLVEKKHDSKFLPIGIDQFPDGAKEFYKKLPVSELKSTMSGAVWIFNRGLGNKPEREIKPGGKLKVKFTDVNIENIYSPSDYVVDGMAIRIFVDTLRNDDINYSNNTSNFVILYSN